MGINKFSDLTNEEFKTLYTQKNPMFHKSRKLNEVFLEGELKSATVDWRT